MTFAIDEINRDPSLLPNVTLGYIVYDTCYSLSVAFRSALSLVSGREGRFRLDESCVGSTPVLGLGGGGGAGRHHVEDVGLGVQGVLAEAVGAADVDVIGAGQIVGDGVTFGS